MSAKDARLSSQPQLGPQPASFRWSCGSTEEGCAMSLVVGEKERGVWSECRVGGHGGGREGSGATCIEYLIKEGRISPQ